MNTSVSQRFYLIPILFSGQGEDLCILLQDGEQTDWQFPKILTDSEEEDEHQRTLRHNFHRTEFFPLSRRDKNTPFPCYPYVQVIEKKETIEIFDGLAWVKLNEIVELGENHGALLCEALGKFWMPFPGQIKEFEKVALPQKFQVMTQDDVVFFGGSFNPLHEGHLECMKLCENQNIIVVPDTNPFKAGPDKRCYFKHLLQLIERIDYAVFPGFCGQEKPNPTSIWIGETSFTKRSLLVGDDSFIALPTWIEIDKTLNAIETLYVVPRTSESSEIQKSKNWVIQKFSNVKLVMLPEHKFQEVSSTQLRENQ